MTEKQSKDKRFEYLRRRAEKLLEGRKSMSDDIFINEYEEVLQELDVYRTELEIQNEELREAQEKLQTSQRRYRDLFESAPIGYLLIDKDGLIVQANIAARELLDKDRMLTGRPLSLFIDAEFVDTYQRFLKSIAARQAVSSCEVRMNTIGGKRRFIRLWGAKENTGEPGNLLMSLSDITELKEAERVERRVRLRVQRSYRELADFHIEIERQYHALIENANEGAAITQDGKIRFVNRTLAGILGGKPEELMAMRMERFIHPDDRDVMTKYYADRLQATMAPLINEIRLVALDGTVRWVRQNNVTIEWKGKPALLHFVADITERKTYQEQLENERHVLKTILDNIPAMVFFYESYDRMIMINSAAEETLGWSLGELQHRDIMEECYPDETLRREAIDFMINRRGEWKDFVVRTKSKESIEVSWFNTQLPNGMCVSIGLDVSLRKRYEQDILAAKDQLENERHILQSILDNIPVMIALYDVNGKIILSNCASEQTLGWSFEELQHMDVMEVGYPDEKVRGQVWNFMMESSGEWRDFPVRTKAGNFIDVSWFNLKLPDGMRLGIGIDISQRKKYEKDLVAAQEALESERSALQDKNIALREVLSQIEAEKETIKNHILINIRRSVLSDLDRLKNQASPSLVKNIELIEKHLKDIASPFIDKFSHRFRELTARELEICRLIKDGLRTKEMADMLNVSIATIQKHRESIRRKLKLTGKGTNLYTYLQSFAEKIDSDKNPRAHRPRRNRR